MSKPRRTLERMEITLNHWNQTLDEAKRIYKLPSPRVTLKDILRQDGARESFEGLRQQVFRSTGTDISPVFAHSLQILPMLPTRDLQKPRHVLRSQYRKLRNLNKRMRDLADELEAVWKDEWQRRLAYPQGRRERDEYAELPELLRRCAHFREDMYAHTAKVHPFGVNPQVRMAQYLGTFFLIVLRNQRDAELALLFDAAFRATGKPVPKWADPARLQVERNLRKRRWQKWMNTIALPPGVSNYPEALQLPLFFP